MSEGSNDACRDILEHIAGYLDGELDVTECHRIEAHCEQCGDCARLVSGLRETVGLCRKAAGTPLPEPVRALARARVQRMLAEGSG